jgi:hypothetical protein
MPTLTLRRLEARPAWPPAAVPAQRASASELRLNCSVYQGIHELRRASDGNSSGTPKHDGRQLQAKPPAGGRGGVGPHHRAQTRTAPTAQSVGGAAPGAATRAGGSARHSRTHAQSLPLECGPGRPPAPHCWPAVRRRASRWRTGALTVPAPGTPPAAHQRAGAAAGGRLLRPGGVRVRPPATFLPEAPFP